jgi:hypothetical protein
MLAPPLPLLPLLPPFALPLLPPFVVPELVPALEVPAWAPPLPPLLVPAVVPEPPLGITSGSSCAAQPAPIIKPSGMDQ